MLAPTRPALALDPKDRVVVGEAFQAAERGEWRRAFRLVAPVADPLPAKTLRWLRMVEDGKPADFATVARFLIANPDWPSPERLQLLAEGTITDPADHDLIRRLFADRAPLTVRGHIRLAEALLRVDQDERAKELIRRAWIDGDFSAREEERFLKKYRRLLTTDDHIARLDNLLWDYRRRSAGRMLPRVPDGYRKLAQARMRLQRRRSGVDQAVAAVPAALRDDPGLVFDRMRWRRQKRRHEAVIELLLDPPRELGRPSHWWFERELQIRRALRKRDFDLAYRLAARHGQTEGDDFAEAEWLAGWLALRFVERPNIALGRFTTLYEGVRAPVDRARAAYWAGRSAAALGETARATEWYRKAAAHPIAYYGQLAAEELGEPAVALADPPAADRALRAGFEGEELVRVARLLIAVGAEDQLAPFLERLGDRAASPAEVGLVAEIAAQSGRPHLVTQLGRYTAYYREANHAVAFPIPEIERLLRPPEGDPEPALLLGVGRQESMFNPWVSSRAGARGMLQLMPRTAFLMARQLGLPYNHGRLTGDPDFNVRLGSHYLKTLLRRYDGETALAVAAYNAGPARVDGWARLHGDPRRRDRHHLVDWIELIPFDETRNYVQRVLEGRDMYRRRLASADPVTVAFRPVKGPIEPLPGPALKPLEVAHGMMIAELVARAPRPELKPAVPAPRVLPAGYRKPPLPRPKPRDAIRMAARQPGGALPIPRAKPEPSS